jgi:hypothetical protein
MDLDLLFPARTRSKEPKSLWPLSNRSDLESSAGEQEVKQVSGFRSQIMYPSPKPDSATGLRTDPSFGGTWNLKPLKGS